MQYSIKKALLIFIFLLTFTGFLSSQIFFEMAYKREYEVQEWDIPKNEKTYYETQLKNTAFKDIKGRVHTAQSLKASIVILNFWASWCGPCLKEFPSLAALQERYPSDQLRIIGINSGSDSLAKIKAIAKKYRLNFLLVVENGEKIAEEFFVNSLPVSLIFHKGRLIEISRGAKDFISTSMVEKLQGLLTD